MYYQKRIKLDEKIIKCVMFGISRESKAYHLYKPKICRILINRDVHFDECRGWDWDNKLLKRELIWESSEIESTREEETPGEYLQEQQVPEYRGTRRRTQPIEELAGRTRQRHVWIKGYVSRTARILIAEEDDDEILTMFIGSADPECFEDAVQLKVWRKAMEAEISSIEKNNTWELIDLPE